MMTLIVSFMFCLRKHLGHCSITHRYCSITHHRSTGELTIPWYYRQSGKCKHPIYKTIYGLYVCAYMTIYSIYFYCTIYVCMCI